MKALNAVADAIYISDMQVTMTKSSDKAFKGSLSLGCTYAKSEQVGQEQGDVNTYVCKEW